MKHRSNTIIALALLLLGSGITIIKHSHAADRTITGVYTAGHGAPSTLEVRVEATHYVVLLSGGGSEAARAAPPADCYVRAKGTLHGRTLTVTFMPVETDTFIYSQAQAEKEKRTLKIVFGQNTADVIRADTFGYCGLGSSFVGHYRRKTAQK